MRLSDNFTLHEMAKSETALRLGLDNTPCQHVIVNLRMLCENILQPIRNYFQTGVKVNSGYRSPEVNIAVGGSPTSDHCTGMAADIEIPGVSNYDLAVWIRDNLYFKQLILEFYTPGIADSGWVHVSYDLDNLRNQVMTAARQNGKTVYLNELVY